MKIILNLFSYLYVIQSSNLYLFIYLFIKCSEPTVTSTFSTGVNLELRKQFYYAKMKVNIADFFSTFIITENKKITPQNLKTSV